MAYNVDELKDALRNYTVIFKYVKKAGEIRFALGTNNLGNVPVEKYPQNKKIPSPSVLTYFDFERNEYRSMRRDNFLDIVYVFK